MINDYWYQLVSTQQLQEWRAAAAQDRLARELTHQRVSGWRQLFARVRQSLAPAPQAGLIRTADDSGAKVV